uniref:Uncharacterized protein n=1 Tax=Knipowitschia caucasica TaxID=637954 RepID=A0AAV2J7J2_KNICA
MAPEQKTQLVKELRKLKYRVGMCGDGANDCGALRAADVGISLSEAEASVASPFTSKIQNISCVPLLIREGRGSLVTSFSLFRYIALYSLIQFCSVLILYTLKTNLADLQFLFFDLVLVTVLAIVMGKGGPSNELHTTRPPASLWSLPVLGSLLIHTFLIILAQSGAILFTRAQDWYVPLNGTLPGEDNWPNIEDTCLFAVSGFQYIFIAVVVTKAHPHKKPLYYNVWFLVLLVLFSGLMAWLVMYPLPFMRRFLSLYNIEDLSYKFVLVGLSALNFFTCLMMEMLVDMGLLNCLRLLRGRRPSKKPYKRLETALLDSPSWPPLNQTLQRPVHLRDLSTSGTSSSLRPVHLRDQSTSGTSPSLRPVHLRDQSISETSPPPGPVHLRDLSTSETCPSPTDLSTSETIHLRDQSTSETCPPPTNLSTSETSPPLRPVHLRDLSTSNRPSISETCPPPTNLSTSETSPPLRPVHLRDQSTSETSPPPTDQSTSETSPPPTDLSTSHRPVHLPQTCPPLRPVHLPQTSPPPTDQSTSHRPVHLPQTSPPPTDQSTSETCPPPTDQSTSHRPVHLPQTCPPLRPVHLHRPVHLPQTSPPPTDQSTSHRPVHL